MLEKFNSDVFISKQKFYDDVNFPYGFNRSGDFTISEANILNAYGSIMSKLHNGELPPKSSEYKEFLKVINNECPATFIEEKVFMKYLQLIESKHKVSFYESSKIKPELSFADDAY